MLIESEILKVGRMRLAYSFIKSAKLVIHPVIYELCCLYFFCKMMVLTSTLLYMYRKKTYFLADMKL